MFLYLRNKLLCITPNLTLITFYFFHKYSIKNIYECYLASLIILSYVLSISFWKNAIKGSFIHRLDAIVAKFSITNLILYTIHHKKFRYSYLFFVNCIICSAILSHIESTKEWNSYRHVVFHLMLHFSCFFTSLYAFM
jgi:hypothetical protein